jgi:mRNA interferase HigB
MNDWYEKVSEADWKNLAEVKKDFNSVDYAGNDRYVFNLKGNQYRIVVMIHFSTRTLYVRFIGTHAAYDRIDATTI